jgi:threonyl-tRNA synthetase
MLVLGDREKEAGTAAVRLRSGEDLGAMKLEELIARMHAEAQERR